MNSANCFIIVAINWGTQSHTGKEGCVIYIPSWPINYPRKFFVLQVTWEREAEELLKLNKLKTALNAANKLNGLIRN